jgi:NitT/TauT family transport system substrate-binding protein
LLNARLWLLSLVILLTSCDHATTDSDRIRLGTNTWPGYAPLHLGSEIGGTKSSQFELVDLATTQELLKGLLVGSLDGGGMTLQELFNARDLGLDLIIVTVTNVSNGADALISQPQFSSIAELKGRKVGCDPTSLCALMLKRAADQAELSPDDFEIVPLTPIEHESAFRSRSVDAVVTFEPALTKLVELGGTRIFSSADIPNEIIDVLVLRRSVIDEQPRIAEQLNALWFDAIQYFTDNPAASYSLMDKRLKIGNPALRQAFKGLTIPSESGAAMLLQNQGAALQPSLRQVQSIMLELGEISAEGPVNTFFLPSDGQQ